MTDLIDSIPKIAETLRQHAVPIADLQHHPDNPRMGDVEAIAESLGRFGQVRPIVVQESTGYIVAGNHTTKAARLLNWSHVAAVKVALDDDAARAYLLADNRLADRGSYDTEALRELLQLASSQGNLAGTGYDEDDLLAMMDDMPTAIPTETVSVDDVKVHDRNPRTHTPEQLEHLTASLREHGIFREIVVANDGTILAGHGIVEALREMGLRKLPVKRLPYGPNDPEALKVIAADNEIGRLVERDDRALTELLKDVRESGDVADLLGTGLDAEQLAGLVLTTRSESEVGDFNAAAEWAGMPDFEPAPDRISLILAFDSEEERDQLIEQLSLVIAKKTRKTWSAWWPPRELEDLSSLRFEAGESGAAPEGDEPGDSSVAALAGEDAPVGDEASIRDEDLPAVASGEASVDDVAERPPVYDDGRSDLVSDTVFVRTDEAMDPASAPLLARTEPEPATTDGAAGNSGVAPAPIEQPPIADAPMPRIAVDPDNPANEVDMDEGRDVLADDAIHADDPEVR